MQVQNLNTWDRKEYFQHYRQFDEPYFGVTTELDMNQAYHKCKAENISLTLYYHYLATKVLNEIKEFRYRIKEEKVILYNIIHTGTTVLREDKTFSFVFIPYSSSLENYLKEGKKAIDKVKRSEGLGFNEDTARIDLIHFSTLPWIRFNGLSHARNFKETLSLPKISFGKIYMAGGIRKMPISIHAHHGLVDGYHVGQVVESLQQLLNE